MSDVGQDWVRRIGVMLAMFAAAWGLIDRMTADMRTQLAAQEQSIKDLEADVERRRVSHSGLRNELHEHMREAHGRLVHLETTGE